MIYKKRCILRHVAFNGAPSGRHFLGFMDVYAPSHMVMGQNPPQYLKETAVSWMVIPPVSHGIFIGNLTHPV
jgi:hypothetical protein